MLITQNNKKNRKTHSCFYGFVAFYDYRLENSSSFFRGKASVRYNQPISVPRFAVRHIATPHCTHYVRLCGVTESAFLRNGIFGTLSPPK